MSSSITASIGSLPTSLSRARKSRTSADSAATGTLMVIRPRYARSIGAMADVAPGEELTDEPASTARLRVRAFAVHIFTATGAALGFLALLAAVRGDWVT